MTIDRMPDLLRAMDILENNRVYVGVPADSDEREEGGEITNAEIGWLMENGIPEQNVPARPHMVPGVRRAQDKITDYLRQAGRLALEARPGGVVRALHAAGTTAVSSVKGVIREGVPPPLADSTVRARARKRRGARLEMERRNSGDAAGLDLVKPLINTGQYLNSITSVIRKIQKPSRRSRAKR